MSKISIGIFERDLGDLKEEWNEIWSGVVALLSAVGGATFLFTVACHFELWYPAVLILPWLVFCFIIGHAKIK